MSKVHVKTGDSVVLLTGKYTVKYDTKGKDKEETSKKPELRVGKVLEVSPKEGKVIVEGFNMVTKHVKPRGTNPGGIVKAESAIYASKVQLVCPKCKKPTRVGHTVEDGKKMRVCKKCNATFK